jgi:hypothetical protein
LHAILGSPPLQTGSRRMNPPRSPGSPSEQSPAATPFAAGGDTFCQCCARHLNAPAIVTDIGDGALLVEPLHFHAVVGRSGRKVVSQSHVSLNSLGGQPEHVA